MFILTADKKFGPITTLRKDGKLVKHIPWTAFRLDDDDWARCPMIIDILNVRNRSWQLFESRADRTDYCLRTQTRYSNVSRAIKPQHCGELFPLLKASSLHGRRNQQTLSTLSISPVLTLASQRSRSIESNSRERRRTVFHLVCILLSSSIISF